MGAVSPATNHNCHIHILYLFSMLLATIAGPRSTTGCGKEINSRRAAKSRLTSQETNRWLNAIMSGAGWRLGSIPKRTDFCTSGSIRYVRSLSPRRFSVNYGRNPTSPMRCFSLAVRRDSRAALRRNTFGFGHVTRGNRNVVELVFEESRYQTRQLSIISTLRPRHPPIRGSRRSYSRGIGYPERYLLPVPQMYLMVADIV